MRRTGMSVFTAARVRAPLSLSHFVPRSGASLSHTKLECPALDPTGTLRS